MFDDAKQPLIELEECLYLVLMLRVEVFLFFNFLHVVLYMSGQFFILQS